MPGPNYCSHPLNSEWAKKLGIRWDDGDARRPCALHDEDYAEGGSLWGKTKADAKFAWRLGSDGAALLMDGHLKRGARLLIAAPAWWAAVTVGGLWAWKWS